MLVKFSIKSTIDDHLQQHFSSTSPQKPRSTTRFSPGACRGSAATATPRRPAHVLCSPVVETDGERRRWGSPKNGWVIFMVIIGHLE